MNRLDRHGYFLSLGCFISFVLLIGSLCAGCKTPPCSEQNFVRAFDPQRVAQLSHDSYKAAWDARFRAREDLRWGAHHPTILDWEAVYYLYRLLDQASWIAHDIEKNPTTPRCSSKISYDMVAFDVVMLKARYSPTSFLPHTDALIER